MMRVLVISDIHDRLESIGKLKRMVGDVDQVVILGDIVSPFTLKTILDEVNPNVMGVFGNNDGDKELLKRISPNVTEQPMELLFDAFKAIAFHGFKSVDLTKKIVYSLCTSTQRYYDIVLYGHTHMYDLSLVNDCLVLNPGALSGYLTSMESYAILSIEGNKVKAEVYDLTNGTLLKVLTLVKP